MSLHESAFGYLTPSDTQKTEMNRARMAAKDYADLLDGIIPDGPDKTYVMRELRGLAMWVNTAITRQPDGAPRA